MFCPSRCAVPLAIWGLTAVLASSCDRAPVVPGPNPAGLKTEAAARGDQTPLRIAAAADLQRALPKLAERFQRRTGTTTTLTFGASGQLAEQIKAGAPFDMFLAANVTFVKDLAAAGLIFPESVQPYARGSLVLVVHRAAGDQVRGLADLSRAEVKKIAIANPVYAPYGLAAKQALERAELWSRIKPKVVWAESVRQALVYAQQGDAEAALVGRAIADVPEVRTIEVDPKLYDPIIQALGIVARTSQPDGAREFARFVLCEEGQTILRECGFAPASSMVKSAENNLPGSGQ
jgi:molybdate transport system substrate-binding protein